MATNIDTAFILSTGRTGTLYLTRLFEQQFDQVATEHEAYPSRYIYLGANACNYFGINRQWLTSIYRHSLEKRLSKSFANNLQDKEKNNLYVEINPMLCPLVDDLSELVNNATVIHIVRDPETWVSSQMSFGASGLYKHVIDYVPFNTPKTPIFGKPWRRLSHIERMIFRWVNYNERISSLERHAKVYKRLRFEELFSENQNLRKECLEQMFSLLGLSTANVDAIAAKNKKVNSSIKKSKFDCVNWRDSERQFLSDNARHLLEQYGYR